MPGRWIFFVFTPECCVAALAVYFCSFLLSAACCLVLLVSFSVSFHAADCVKICLLFDSLFSPTIFWKADNEEAWSFFSIFTCSLLMAWIIFCNLLYEKQTAEAFPSRHLMIFSFLKHWLILGRAGIMKVGKVTWGNPCSSYKNLGGKE